MVAGGGGGGGMVVAGGGAAGGAAGCAGECGGAEALCIEAEGVVKNANWQYVGHGSGRYEKTAGYSYVGEGCGSYDQQEIVTAYGWKIKPVCMCLAVVAVVVGAVVFLWPTEVSTTSTLPTAVKPFTRPPTLAPVPKPTLAPRPTQAPPKAPPKPKPMPTQAPPKPKPMPR